jgi:magnesium-transporting ATPase (P-type)
MNTVTCPVIWGSAAGTMYNSPIVWTVARFRGSFLCRPHESSRREMRLHSLSAEKALRSLHSGPNGLSSAEAERRLREFGPNRVERVQGAPRLARFLKGFTHFFALILGVAAAVAFLAERQESV